MCAVQLLRFSVRESAREKRHGGESKNAMQLNDDCYHSGTSTLKTA